MRKLLPVIFMLMVASSLAMAQQKHRTVGARCIYYVPTKGGVTPDASTGCPVCDEDRRKKYDEEARKAREQLKLREEKIAREVAEARAKVKDEAAKREQRNNIALAEINDIKRQSDDFDRIRREETARAKAINEKYNNLVEKGNREYSEYLSRLQDAAGASIAGTDDDFWNETIAPANYMVFRGKNNLFGFVDKQGKVKIEPRYYYAQDFSGGISYVTEPKTYASLLINSKGKVIKRLDKQFLEEVQRKSGVTINSFSRPDTIANGMIVLKFSTRDRSNNYAERYGCLDKEGNLVIPPLFHKIHAFKNGTAQASKFIDNDQTTFENTDYTFSARYTYVDAGLIDKTGTWVKSPQKKMEYSYSSSRKLYLTVTGPDWDRLTSAEKKAINERIDLKRKQTYAADMKRLESQVKSKVSSAQAQGYLIEQIK